MKSAREAATVPAQHAWPLRLLRSVQFGFARLASRDGYIEAHAAPFDLTFTGPAADCITRHIYRLGAHEPAITRYLLDHVRLGAEDVAMDVGANLGWYSLLLSRLSVAGARIFAFEPDPESYRLLGRNVRANAASQVTALNIALGETAGFAELHRYKASNNGRHTLLPGSTSGGSVRVPVMTLESFWKSQHLGERRICLLKVDVEGYEYFVLRGAGELLGRCARILLEYSPASLPLAGLRPDALIDLFRRAGLSAHAFVHGKPVPMSFERLARAETQHDLLLMPAGVPP